MTVEAVSFERAVGGAGLRLALPDIEAELDEMDEKLTREVMTLIVAGKLTPEIAQAKWLSLHAQRELRRRLLRKGQEV